MPLIDERKKLSGITSKRLTKIASGLMDFNYQYCFNRNLMLTPEDLIRTILLKRVEINPLTHKVPERFLTITGYKWSINPEIEALYPHAVKIVDLFIKENPEWNKGIKS